MKTNKSPTWTIGDGTLFADSLSVLVKRDFAQPLGTNAKFEGREVHDLWILSATHSDGCGNSVTSNISLDHKFYNGKSSTFITNVSNSLGDWKGRNTFSQIDIEKQEPDLSALSNPDACLARIVKGIYDYCRATSGIECSNGTPISLSEDEGAIFFKEQSKISLKLFDPVEINYADVGQLLAESTSGNLNLLTVQMNSMVSDDRGEQVAHAMKVRHEDIGLNQLPDGVTYRQFVAALVDKGLSLEAYENTTPDFDLDDHEEAPVRLIPGTTCLLAEAIDRNDITAIGGLISCGADPLLPLISRVDGQVTQTTPFKSAVLSGQAEAVVAVLNSANDKNAHDLIDAYKSIEQPFSRDVECAMKAFQARVALINMTKGKSPAPC